MRICEVIGRITLSRCHPSVAGSIWKLAVPLARAGLNGGEEGRGEALVVFDELGSGTGSLIAVSEGAEAAAPFQPNPKPIDAYNAALLDVVTVPE